MRCWDANLSGWRRDTTSRTILHDRKCHTCGVWDLAERKRISLDVQGVLGIKNISTMVRLSIKSSLSSTAEYLTPALCFGDWCSHHLTPVLPLSKSCNYMAQSVLPTSTHASLAVIPQACQAHWTGSCLQHVNPGCYKPTSNACRQQRLPKKPTLVALAQSRSAMLEADTR